MHQEILMEIFFFYNINGDDDEKEIYMLNLFPNEK